MKKLPKTLLIQRWQDGNEEFFVVDTSINSAQENRMNLKINSFVGVYELTSEAELHQEVPRLIDRKTKKQIFSIKN